MQKEGKYIYCIIETEQERNFGPIGIGQRGDEVLTVGYDDLSMVVSNYPAAKLAARREHLLAHQKVIEQVMNEFDSVLPVRFGTIASGADEMRNLLDRRYREFKTVLTNMDHKIELGVKATWKSMEDIFSEIGRSNSQIRLLKDKISGGAGGPDTQVRIEVGKMVKDALQQMKEQEAEEIVNALGRTAFDHKLNRTIGDNMLINAAFLVSKAREKEFDNIMDDLSEQYRNRMSFAYTGPLPVFNFVDIVIYPEEWEK
ncbi:MAG: gas vesicle synthesis GvpLGvpF [Planctomycetes bacterium RBG_16_55_9]|nr:MAG: gas vesicle synthesis GvpLGvpF [Planctomycetes bacterium RBG_16_55_9]